MTEPTDAENKPPPNPFYCRFYTTTVSGGYAHVSIPAPGGNVSRQNAAYLIEWLVLIIKKLEQDESNHKEPNDG